MNDDLKFLLAILIVMGVFGCFLLAYYTTYWAIRVELLLQRILNELRKRRSRG